jgi:hypothetical protein
MENANEIIVDALNFKKEKCYHFSLVNDLENIKELYLLKLFMIKKPTEIKTLEDVNKELEIQLINTKVSSLDNRLREIYSEIQDFL